MFIAMCTLEQGLSSFLLFSVRVVGLRPQVVNY